MNLGKRCAFPLASTPKPDSRRRDRGRGGLFGSELEEGALHDPERLERQNDAEIDSINERAKHLKEVGPRARRPAGRC